MDTKIEDDFIKICKIIESSKTKEHFIASINMIKAFNKKWPNSDKTLIKILYKKLFEKSTKT